MYDCSGDYDTPELYHEKIVKGRKDHRCYECSKTIEKGEYHHCIKGKWEGCFNEYRICLECEAILNEIKSFYENTCICLPFGSLSQLIRDAKSDGWNEEWCLTAHERSNGK
jgi:hypothetical protein